MRFLTALFLFALAALPVRADAPADLGPAVGTNIASLIQAPDQTGKAQNYASLVGDKGAVLVFFRSAKWCPYCQMQLIDLNLHAEKMAAERGYRMIGISYDAPETLAKFATKWEMKFPLLSDQGSKIIEALGIRNTEFKQGHYAYGVPHPLILIADAEGTITAKLHEAAYKDRPEVRVILEAIDKAD